MSDNDTDTSQQNSNSKDIHRKNDEFITKTSGIDNDTTTPERGDFEIGINRGDGYLIIPIYRDGTLARFQIPRKEVDEYKQRRNEKTPIPELPESTNREPIISTPEDWNGGKAVNTGGGIFARTWRKEYQGYHIALGFQVPRQDGIQVYMETDEMDFMGEVTHVAFNKPKKDTRLQKEANKLIQKIDQGEFEDAIEETITQYESD